MRSLESRLPFLGQLHDTESLIILVRAQCQQILGHQTLDDPFDRGRVHRRHASQFVLGQRAKLIESGKGGELCRRHTVNMPAEDRDMALIGPPEVETDLI